MTVVGARAGRAAAHPEDTHAYHGWSSRVATLLAAAGPGADTASEWFPQQIASFRC